MYKTIALVAIFLAIFYVLTFLRLRKKKREKENETSFVEEFKRRYKKDENDRSLNAVYDGVPEENVITDYIDKEDFIDEVKAQIKNEGNKKAKQISFKF